MNIKNTDTLIAYILSVAAQQDLGDRELGPIHIIKYVYLADLEYAQQNNGQTFTDIKWQFYDFGPWSTELYKRIEPVAQSIGADIKTITSKKYGDYTRYYLQDDQLRDSLDQQMPLEITSAVGWAVRKFTNDTESLLNHVYLTEPMLNAAPGEFMSFPETSTHILEKQQSKKNMTRRQEKKWEQAVKMAKEKFRILTKKKLDEEMKCKQFMPNPPCDDDYIKALAVFDEMDGPSIQESEGELLFSEDVWRSDWRKGPERD